MQTAPRARQRRPEEFREISPDRCARRHSAASCANVGVAARLRGQIFDLQTFRVVLRPDHDVTPQLERTRGRLGRRLNGEHQKSAGSPCVSRHSVRSACGVRRPFVPALAPATASSALTSGPRSMIFAVRELDLVHRQNFAIVRPVRHR